MLDQLRSSSVPSKFIAELVRHAPSKSLGSLVPAANARALFSEPSTPAKNIPGLRCHWALASHTPAACWPAGIAVGVLACRGTWLNDPVGIVCQTTGDSGGVSANAGRTNPTAAHARPV